MVIAAYLGWEDGFSYILLMSKASILNYHKKTKLIAVASVVAAIRGSHVTTSQPRP